MCLCMCAYVHAPAYILAQVLWSAQKCVWKLCLHIFNAGRLFVCVYVYVCVCVCVVRDYMEHIYVCCNVSV